MHLFFGHVFVNNTYAVLTFILMIKRIIILGIFGICIRTSPMSVSVQIMPPLIQMKRMSFCAKKGTVESEYDDDLDDDDD